MRPLRYPRSHRQRLRDARDNIMFHFGTMPHEEKGKRTLAAHAMRLVSATTELLQGWYPVWPDKDDPPLGDDAVTIDLTDDDHLRAIATWVHNTINLREDDKVNIALRYCGEDGILRPRVTVERAPLEVPGDG